MGKAGTGKAVAMPWPQVAQRRAVPLQNIPYDGGLNQPITRQVAPTGFQEKLRVVQNITETASVAPTGVDAFGPVAGVINRFQVQTQGLSPLIDLSGEGLALVSAIHMDYDSGYGTTTPPNAYGVNTSPGTAATRQRIGYTVPLAIDVAEFNSPVGLYNNAVVNPNILSVNAYFRPFLGSVGVPGSGFVTGGAGVYTTSGPGLEIEQEYYEPVGDVGSMPFLGYIHTWREFKQSVAADGTFQIPLLENRYVLRIAVMLVSGAANAVAPDATHVSEIAFKFAGQSTIVDYPVDLLLQRMDDQYSFAVPAGWYVLDFISDSHSRRDWIDTRVLPNPRVEVTQSGATYSGGAYYKVLVEEMTINPQGIAPVRG